MAAIPGYKLEVEQAMEHGLSYAEKREYLGMSQIGHHCTRYLWYSFRWCFTKELTRREERIFERGNLEEERIIRDLNRIGIRIEDQQYEVSDVLGFFKGHVDGVAFGVTGSKKTPHLLEIKTAAQKYFIKLKKEGVKAYSPIYWAQAQMYMGKLGLTRCLFIATNKDNEERYYERIRFDKRLYDELLMRAMDIIGSDFPPPKIGDSDWYQCKMCDARQVCHLMEVPVKNCRTCRFAKMENGGIWRCGNDNEELGKYKALMGCQDHRLLESLEQ